MLHTTFEVEMTIVIYVDDMLLFSSRMGLINETIQKIKGSVKVEVEYDVSHYLGVDINFHRDLVELKKT